MATLTEQQQQDIIKACVATFNAAPGVTYMNALASFGTNIPALYEALTALPTFQTQQFAYSLAANNAQFAKAFVTNLIGDKGVNVTDANWDLAVTWAKTQLDGGATRGHVMKAAVDLLYTVGTSDADWGHAAALLENRVTVASDYTINESGSSTDIGILKGTIATVDATQASVDAALANNLGAGGQVFNLTVNVDNFTGSTGNDTFNANYDVASGTHTLSGLDKIDGGGGINTLNVTDSNGGYIDLSQADSIKHIQVLKISSAGDFNTNTMDFTSLTPGLTTLNVSYNSSSNMYFTADDTTTVTINNKDYGRINFVGGKTLAVTANQEFDTSASGVFVTGLDGLTSVSISGAYNASVLDDSTSGDVLKSVTLDHFSPTTTIDLTGDGITSVTLSNYEGQSSTGVWLHNSKTHTLDLKLDSVNTDVSGNWLWVDDETATTVNLTSTGDGNAVTAYFSSATALNISGDAALSLFEGSLDAVTKVTVTGSVDFTGTDMEAWSSLAVFDGSGNSGDVIIDIAGTSTGTGAVAQTIKTGSGDDTVTITGTLGDGGTVDLGAGNDTIVVDGGAITADAVVDGGAGTDALGLISVGSSNVGAFKNFETFDVAGASTGFDVTILATNNTVTNIIGSAATATNYALSNLGAGVGFIITGDMGTTYTTTLGQATAGAMTITSNVDETKAGDDTQATTAKFSVSNATSLKVVFDDNNVDTYADWTNTSALTVTGTAATTLSIVSGGAEVHNTLAYTSGTTTVVASGSVTAVQTNDVLTSVTITGSQELAYSNASAGTVKTTKIDASGMTGGGLTVDINSDLTSTGTLLLGSAGDDFVTLKTGVNSSTVTGTQSIASYHKGSAEGLTAQDGFDVLFVTSAVQAADVTAATATDYSIKDGLYKFGGAGPATLIAAATELVTNLADNEAVVVKYAGSYYVYANNVDATLNDNAFVKLTGVTSASGLDTDGSTGELYVF
jgi:hypothetical protein